MDIDAIYAGIVDGSGDPGDLQWTRRKLQLMALDKSRSPEVDARMGALRVASVLGPETGRPVIERLVRDSDAAVRTWAFNQAVAARAGGLPILRDAIGGADEVLALAALDLLTMRVDRASLPAVRRLLDSSSPAIRAAAARLVGHLGGPAVLVQLRRLVDDADPVVRHEVGEAIERVQGERPVGSPQDWWDDGVAELPSPPPVGGPEPRAVPEPAHRAAAMEAPEPVPQPPVATEPEPEPHQPHEPPAASPAPERVAPAPQLPTVTAPEPDVAWDGTASRLPATLPTEPRALAKLLGMVSAADHGPVLSALEQVDVRELATLLGSWPAGGDAALGRGLALVAAHQGRASAFSKLRQMASDSQASVRAAAAQGIAAVGGASAIPVFQGLLADVEPEVRVAGVTGLAALCCRIGRTDLGRDYLDRMGGDQPDVVADAMAAARSELDS